jgi:hypothetical protein
MSRVLVTVGSIASGHRVFVGLLAAGRAAGTMVGSSTYGALVRAMADTGSLRFGAQLSVAAAERDHDTGLLDAATGCEFVDDRLRRFE